MLWAYFIYLLVSNFVTSPFIPCFVTSHCILDMLFLSMLGCETPGLSSMSFEPKMLEVPGLRTGPEKI